MLLSKVLKPSPKCLLRSAFSKVPSLLMSPATPDFKTAVLNIEGPGQLNDLVNDISPLHLRHFFKKEIGCE